MIGLEYRKAQADNNQGETMPTTRTNILTAVSHGTYETCKACNGLVLSDSEWEGEDKNGRGWFTVTDRCEDCGNWISSKVAE